MGYADKPARRKRARDVQTDPRKLSGTPKDSTKHLLSRTDDAGDDLGATFIQPPAPDTADTGHTEGATGLLALVDAAAARNRPVAPSAERSQAPRRISLVSDDGENDNYDPRPKCASLPRVLMALLDGEANPEIMTWLPDGDAFAILDPKAFASGLMKERFKVARFETFVRKLAMWGFEETTPGGRFLGGELAGVKTFRHPNFKRGDWDACRQIRCRKNRQSIVFTVPMLEVSSLSTIPASPPSAIAVRAAPSPSASPAASVASEEGLTPTASQELPSLKRAGSASSLPQERAIGRISENEETPTKNEGAPKDLAFSPRAADNTTARCVMGAALGVMMRDKMRNQQVRMKQRCAMQRQQLQLQMQRRSSLSMQGQMFDSRELQAKMMLQQQRHQTIRGFFAQRHCSVNTGA